MAVKILCIQHKQILERTLPDAIKLVAIAKKIENNLFSKVWHDLY